MAAYQLNGAKAHIGQVPIRVLCDGVLVVADRRIEVPETGQGIPADNLCRHVLRIDLERCISARARVLECRGQQQQIARFELRLETLRKKVCGTHIFAHRMPPVFERDVGITELQPGFSEPRIVLERAAQLDDRFGILPLIEIGGAPLQVLFRAGLPAARREHAPEQDD